MLRVLIYILSCLSLAYSIKVKAYIDKNNINIDDLIIYKIEIEDANDFGELDFSKIKKSFEIISGPNQQTSMQWINGEVTNTRILSWTLSPKRVGKLIIPSFTINFKNKKTKTNAIKINVEKATVDKSSLNAFLTAEIDKENAYIGEQVTLTYKLYKNIELSLEPFEIPEFSGFWTEELFRPNQLKFKNVNINGVRYQVSTLYRAALFPITGSHYDIDPLKVKIKLQKRRKRQSRDPFFDPFFDSFFTETETKILRSPNREINIKQFPNPIPDGFTGAVGNFEINTSIDIDSVFVNEAVTFKISISGTGNLGLFTLPKIIFSDQIDQFPPTEKFEKNVFRNELSGKITWEYILVPRVSGKISIPPVRIAYFNTDLNKWKILESKSLIIPVKKTKNDYYSEGSFSKKELKFLDQDIRHIKSKDFNWLDINRTNNISILATYLFSILLLLMPILIKVFNRYNINFNIVKLPNYAYKNALKKINTNTKNDTHLKIIYMYFKEKLNLETEKLDLNTIKNILNGKIEETIIDDLIAHLKICEQFHYGLDDNVNLDLINNKTKDILKKVDKKLP